MAAYRNTLAMVLSILVITEAKPQCTTHNEKDVVCKADRADYKLVRGLVSDNNTTVGITLRSCRIIDIEFESFNDLNSLKYLDLSHNKIHTLKLGVIDEPKQLTFLNLSYNLITEFPLGLFDQLTNLELLDLKGNKISKIELGIFDPLVKLKFLDLSSNVLISKELNPYIFDQSPHITFMDFSRNDMADAPENLLHAFHSIEILNLDRCFLSQVPEFAMKSNMNTMTFLILTTNQIATLNNAATFVNYDSLEALDLSYNIIESINENILSPLKKLQKIVLRHNRLKTIPDNLFRNMPKLIVIHLNGNYIQDVQASVFRGSPVKYLNLSNNRLTYLQDNFCLELKNSGGKLKKFLFEPNPWQCACLNDLLKEVNRLGIEYNSNKYNGKNPVCVTTNEFNCKRQQNINDFYIEMYNDVTEVQLNP